MQGILKLELIFFLISFICTCLYCMKVDFTRLRQLRKPFLLNKRGDTCSSNPCPDDKPFLCKSSEKTCLALSEVCDGTQQCPGGYDENPRLCNARNRPSVEDLEDFLYRNEDWMELKLFNGAPPEIVAHALAVSGDIDELDRIVGLDHESKQNLRDALMAIEEADERPLTDMGMPESEWYDVSYVFNKLLEGGFKY
ncbi:hypothetical protein FSP39_024635 [Pinctada imbricata]|uniref:Prohormone-4 n=1 Tax=Pinctada imbricata TaxID=66713 RepID=A0AA88YD11_PINIB|nr:hypothetical protein FSP39_024635 [Pinctada imbricata]